MSEEKPVETTVTEVTSTPETLEGQEKKMEGYDEYDHYTFDHDKHMFSGKSGKMRSKKEASQNTNHPDTCGHTRKLVTKLHNMEHNKHPHLEKK
ncbi:nuclear protein 1-like [Tubulanus polymorphus]|uniref:nuclear protein 1-like n=1 Tax=Tubulanus polymorphus TaxID=672921 RepID=UPI003DA2D57F